jgi:hypothetical protein
MSLEDPLILNNQLVQAGNHSLEQIYIVLIKQFLKLENEIIKLKFPSLKALTCFLMQEDILCQYLTSIRYSRVRLFLTHL